MSTFNWSPLFCARGDELNADLLVGSCDDPILPPPGPQGPRGLQGIQGIQGLQGPRGFKGDPGNYVTFNLIGVSNTLDDRPSSANNGDVWALLDADGVISNLYVWNAPFDRWDDAGSLMSPASDRAYQNMVFVRPDGSASNSGRNPAAAKATVEQAAAISTPGTAILVYPSTYTSDGHIDIPDDVAVITVGKGRVTALRPTPGNEARNQFRLGNGSYVEGFSCNGWQVDDLSNPSEGFAISFRPGALILRVPYAHNIVVYRDGPPSLISPPMDRRNGNPLVGNGGGVALADGAMVSQYSAFPNIMLWGATPSVPNGVGYCAKNGAFINAVNAIGLWAHKHFMCIDGGQMILSGCSSQFGDYSLWSEGFTYYGKTIRTSVAKSTSSAASTAIETNIDAIVDSTWAALVTGGYTATWDAEDETFTRMDTKYLLVALATSLIGGTQVPMLQFQAGMFDYKGDVIFSIDKLPAFLYSFEYVKNAVIGLGIDAGSSAYVTGLIDALVTCVSTPVKRKKYSLLTSINHQWSLTGAGVTRAALPPNARGTGKVLTINNSVVQKRGGKVVKSGQDDAGNAEFVGGLNINARTGQIGGRPFDTAVQQQAIKAVIAGSF